ncbi:HDIG domain-containing protein [Euhalothece natronophila Z-M001]|uniref:HDIG domain-containing protein n=1 Tax=Euhalothece natronophila Z-M001 TaxID=522448 RepID=A0A5B8NPW2_9CHRO|nr:HDIG domain-containing metalloprotein [Euhalothece natronophila]QDZ41054.1 HDIG domain-containing protein [Euhalothece natronophila Z-M001]
MKYASRMIQLLTRHRRNWLSLTRFIKRWGGLFSGSGLVFLLAVSTLTGVVGNSLYNQPQLGMGARSPQTIVAPSDLTIKNERETEIKREQMREQQTPVLKIDQEKNNQILKALDTQLAELSTLRQQAGADLFIGTNRISEVVQVYLRTCSPREWSEILGSLDEPVENPNSLLKNAQNQLYRLSQILSPREFSDVITTIQEVREQYRNTLTNTREPHDWETNQLSKAQKMVLLQLSPSGWENTKSGIKRTARQMLAQGISAGIPTSVLDNAISVQLEGKVPAVSGFLAIELLQDLLEPNLIEDHVQTERQAEQAASEVTPVMLSIEEGETIVREGETISYEQFLLLDAFELSQRSINWLGLIGCVILVSFAIAIFWLVKRQVRRDLRLRDQLLLTFLSIISPLLLMLGVPYSALPAVALLVSSFYGPTLALTQVSLLTGLQVYMLVSAEETLIPWEALMTGAIGGLLAATIAGKLRSREELALLGGGIGLVQGAVYLFLSFATNGTGEIYLAEGIFHGLSGLGGSIIAFGLSPYLERLFDLVTPIRLAELANPNRPMLQRLAIETPGTFQHTLFVSSLAEAAARELNCNVELVRAGTLYHDIGKMHDPLGFIENQMGCKNKHDEINDPYESAKIIKKHVTQGLVMARRIGLPKVIQDFIPEHQGTLLISYFYFQAKQQGNGDVSEADFRYDGPTPQSRETGIVMLADGCEAALRSLNDVSEEQALAMVNKIIRARWQDQQLKDANLTKTELKQVAQVFVRVWQQSNHKRIAYPKAALDAKYSSSLKKKEC